MRLTISIAQRNHNFTCHFLTSVSFMSASLWQHHGSVMATERHCFWKPPSAWPNYNTNPAFSHLSTSAIVFEKHRFLYAFVDLPGLVWTGPLKADNITLTLRFHHWRPMHFRIYLKLCLLLIIYEHWAKVHLWTACWWTTPSTALVIRAWPSRKQEHRIVQYNIV